MATESTESVSNRYIVGAAVVGLFLPELVA